MTQPLSAQRGFAILEAMLVVCVLALAVGGTFAAVSAVARHNPDEPHRTAAAQRAQMLLAVVADSWKYAGAAIPLGSVTASGALQPAIPNATPMPVSITLNERLDPSDPGGQTLDASVIVRYPDGSQSRSLTFSSILRALAPEPGATIAPSGLVAQPSGAP